MRLASMTQSRHDGLSCNVLWHQYDYHEAQVDISSNERKRRKKREKKKKKKRKRGEKKRSTICAASKTSPGRAA